MTDKITTAVCVGGPRHGQTLLLNKARTVLYFPDETEGVAVAYAEPYPERTLQYRISNGLHPPRQGGSTKDFANGHVLLFFEYQGTV